MSGIDLDSLTPTENRLTQIEKRLVRIEGELNFRLSIFIALSVQRSKRDEGRLCPEALTLLDTVQKPLGGQHSLTFCAPTRNDAQA